MKVEEIKEGMKVVCKEPHYNDVLYWARPEMDKAIGKPMTVIMSPTDGTVYCEFETDYPEDDGRWCFMPDWLEPIKES